MRHIDFSSSFALYKLWISKIELKLQMKKQIAMLLNAALVQKNDNFNNAESQLRKKRKNIYRCILNYEDSNINRYQIVLVKK